MADPYFSKVTMLLQFEGTNGSTVINDPKFGVWSVLAGDSINATAGFSGTGALDCSGGSGCIYRAGSSSVWNGTGNITVEARVKIPSNPGSYYYILGDQYTGVTFLRINSNGTVSFMMGGGAMTTSSLTVGDNNWHHIAGVRYSNSCSLYIDGAQSGTPSTDTNSVTNTGTIVVAAAHSTGADRLVGYIDEVRVTKIARYTSNFTPNTSPFPTSGPQLETSKIKQLRPTLNKTALVRASSIRAIGL